VLGTTKKVEKVEGEKGGGELNKTVSLNESQDLDSKGLSDNCIECKLNFTPQLVKT